MDITRIIKAIQRSSHLKDSQLRRDYPELFAIQYQLDLENELREIKEDWQRAVAKVRIGKEQLKISAEEKTRRAEITARIRAEE